MDRFGENFSVNFGPKNDFLIFWNDKLLLLLFNACHQVQFQKI